MDGFKDLIEKFSINLISWTFLILGVSVILDILIIKNEMLKVGIIILSLLGGLYIISNFFNFIKNIFKNMNEKSKLKQERIDRINQNKKDFNKLDEEKQKILWDVFF